MENTIVKFELEAKELKNQLIRAALDDNVDFTDTEDEDAMMMAKTLRFLDTTCKLVVEQAKTIEGIKTTLNTILDNERLVLNLLLHDTNEQKVNEEEI